MAPIFGIWNPVEPKLLRRVHDRLTRTGGCTAVRCEPSRRNANEVIAEIDPAVFLGREYSTEQAQLRVEFELGDQRTRYWVHWWEPDTERGFGWHADETEPEYGPVHFQIESSDGTIERQSATNIDDEHPYRTFERLLTQIPEQILQLEWE